ncbi:MAG: single-stranded DNA-binding protein, partial [Candidatus Sericytochromatia bacterium]
LSEDSSETINSHIKISASRKLADKCLDEVKKGSVVLVEGKLYTKVSENRFGQKQKLPYIQATNVQVIKEKDIFDIPIPIFSEPTSEVEKIDDEEIPF